MTKRQPFFIPFAFVLLILYLTLHAVDNSTALTSTRIATFTKGQSFVGRKHERQALPIPKLIHIATDSITEKVQQNINEWKRLNPSFTVHIYNDSARVQMIKEHLPEFHQLYQYLYTPVERTDLWRYL